MDVREQLRRFLEQRRDLGESELVLDTMSVEEVMRLVGATGTSARARATPTPASAADWRAALRAEPTTGRSIAEPPTALEAPRTKPTGLPSALSPATPPAPNANAPVAPRRPADAADAGHAELPAGLSVGSAAPEMFGGATGPWSSLTDVASAVAGCTLCPLASGAKNPVPGEGNPNADFVCVGEAPGATEDEQGRPFVGQAGQLLTKILAAIDLSRDDVFICNVLKHRPPGNRNPLPEEVKACSPYLQRQIELLKPRVILALGTFAAQTLLQTKESIGKLRGRVHRYNGVPLIVTYHPAALLRNPAWKRPTWEDVQLARRLLDRQPPARDA